MAIVTYATVAPHIAPSVPGCPTPVIVDALRKASIEFYDRSMAYRTWLPVFDLIATTSTYTLTGFPTETELAQLLELTCDGDRLQPASHEAYIYSDPDRTKEASRPYGYTMTNKPDVIVFPIPTETVVDAFLAFVAVKPTRASTGIEDHYMTQFREYLVNGALAILYLLPGQSWANPQMSTFHRASFNSGVELARIQVNKGVTRADLRVTPRVWV